MVEQLEELQASSTLLTEILLLDLGILPIQVINLARSWESTLPKRYTSWTIPYLTKLVYYTYPITFRKEQNNTLALLANLILLSRHAIPDKI